MNVYNSIIAMLEKREMAFVDHFIPYYISSFGAHMFNLYNLKKGVYQEHARTPDLRLHIMMVAPPGFSKSFFSRQLLHQEYGMMTIPQVPTTFEGYMTQAGFVGTFKQDSKGAIVKQPGVIELFKEGIVATEEFDAITSAMKQQHSFGLDSAFLDALDGGRVIKRQAGGVIDITTHMTFWGATQVARFNLTGGLGRRLFFLLWVPSRSERNQVKTARRKGRNVAFDPVRTSSVRQKIADIRTKLTKIKSVEFSPDFDDFIKGRVHYEDMLFERLGIGYHVMRNEFKTELYVDLDSTLEILMRRSMGWRDRLLAEAEGDQVIQVLRDNGGAMTIETLRDELVVYGMDYRASQVLINGLLAAKLIFIKSGKIKVKGG